MKIKALQQIFDRLKGVDPKAFFVGLGVGVLAFVALDVVLIGRSQVDGIAAMDKKVLQIKTDITALAANKQRMSSFRANLEKARGEMLAFKAMVHREDNIPSVLKDVSTMANQYGVKIDQITPQKSDGVVLVKNEDGKYRSVSILVRARAGYHDLGRFLNRLQQEGVFWQLDAVDITADQVDPMHHLVKMQMKILILGE